MHDTSTVTRPLSGICVVTVEHFIAGPMSTMLLADLGAEVIKVELPEGEVYRRNPPVYTDEKGSTSYSFMRANRNKKSIALDFRTEKGARILEGLISRADVLVENFRPGMFAKMGFGWDKLQKINPRLIYGTITGFGHEDVLASPMADLPAFDIIAQAMSGIMWRPAKPGEPPTYLGLPLSDIIAGIMNTMGVLAALNLRQITGHGTRVDRSMYDSTLMLMESVVAYWSHFGKEAGRGASSTSCPYNVFKARDGYFVVGVAGETMWHRFCHAINRKDLLARPELSSGKQRAELLETIIRPLLEGWASERTVAEVTTHFQEKGIPVAPVQNIPDLFTCKHVEARNMLVELDDPVIGKMSVVGNALKFSAVPEIEKNPPPQLGADSEAILNGMLGMSHAEIADLKASGTVKAPHEGGNVE